ncbi:hypothetical protein [Aquimarina sp. 2201CG5-10]|uniref:hypothetical protein n=1 Tax=Aquimarina callyspongiae TaxID=3098150 RepID=UPI002AB3386D|nr:hypothetical protein [Aquimarina sp. 2201CG5-10]MDY8134033.1 hypothetical protein [Aquimarina sp. 2201CG5-10]
MKSIYRLTVLLFGIVLIVNCTKETPLRSDFEAQVFIFGYISNQVDYVTVNVQSTVPVNSTETNPVTNASISLFTKDSNDNTSLVTDDFTESNGEYQSSQMITPISGNYYWIELETTDGVSFISAQEKMNPPVLIKEITKDNGNLRVIFNDPGNQANFYRVTISSSDTNNNFITRETQLSNDILFDGNENAFIEISEVFENNIEATLVNLNYDSYQFFLNVAAQEEANDNDGESGDPGPLFSPPPVNLTGNITNTTINKKALGNFSVISADSRTANF